MAYLDIDTFALFDWSAFFTRSIALGNVTFARRHGMCVYDEEEARMDSRGKNEGSCDKVIHSMRCDF